MKFCKEVKIPIWVIHYSSFLDDWVLTPTLLGSLNPLGFTCSQGNVEYLCVLNPASTLEPPGELYKQHDAWSQTFFSDMNLGLTTLGLLDH